MRTAGVQAASRVGIGKARTTAAVKATAAVSSKDKDLAAPANLRAVMGARSTVNARSTVSAAATAAAASSSAADFAANSNAVTKGPLPNDRTTAGSTSPNRSSSPIRPVFRVTSDPRSVAPNTVPAGRIIPDTAHIAARGPRGTHGPMTGSRKSSARSCPTTR